MSQAGEAPGPGGETPGDARRVRRKHRRVVAPPTNQGRETSSTPEADWADWLSAKDDDEPAPTGLSERDRWFLQQRPPHWG